MKDKDMWIMLPAPRDYTIPDRKPPTWEEIQQELKEDIKRNPISWYLLSK